MQAATDSNRYEEGDVNIACVAPRVIDEPGSFIAHVDVALHACLYLYGWILSQRMYDLLVPCTYTQSISKQFDPISTDVSCTCEYHNTSPRWGSYDADIVVL